MNDEPYDSRYVHWFGPPWPSESLRAPVCEDDRYLIMTPAAADCLLCEEPILAGDRGIRYSGNSGYAHAECNLRSVTGNLTHISGNCHYIGECNNTDKSYREQALEVWTYLVVEGNSL
jgi:hypothetical protein